MPEINYHNRCFVGVENYDDGDLTGAIVFKYQQKNDVVWAMFEGGRVKFGTLIAEIDSDGNLTMCWQYLNVDGEFISGTCRSRLEILVDGRYRLHESWSVHGSGDRGTSVIEEVRC